MGNNVNVGLLLEKSKVLLKKFIILRFLQLFILQGDIF